MEAVTEFLKGLDREYLEDIYFDYFINGPLLSAKDAQKLTVAYDGNPLMDIRTVLGLCLGKRICTVEDAKAALVAYHLKK